MTQRERNLLDKGYVFTGKYTRDKEEAKSYAKTLRDSGDFFAQVLTEVSEGRVCSTTGYSVYAKSKKTVRVVQRFLI